MKKRKNSLLLVIGVLLIFISIVLIVVMQVYLQVGALNNKKVVTRMNELLADRSTGVPNSYSNPDMPTIQINGQDYVALLQISTMDILLPIANTWDTGNILTVPSRFCGSCYNDSLVLGGFDSSKQFSFCDKIDNGTNITITDMTGREFSYTVSCVERSDNAESQWLTDSNYDLTLFCRDIYSMKYVAVRCEYAYK